MDFSFGIRVAGDDCGYGRPIIRLKVTNYKVWSTVIEQTSRENKLWQHIIGTPIRPFVVRMVSLAVGVVVAAPGVYAVAGATEVT